MSYHARRTLPPGALRNRKERETASYSMWPSSPVMAVNKATVSSKQAEPFSSNRLLAGYMAYEFLTKGTVFGQIFDQARAEAVSASSTDEVGRGKSGTEPEPEQGNQTYNEVASLLKSDGAHIPGIVNPTQLAQWLQM
ncbi:unnamed protein product [Cuscuta epithymum]|uniref:Embryo sac development arrest 6 n=1 Tax=Cuscuta epithymum TaxID=186058 RepID=A0AAV0CMM0_9ASTE|nr:unnamed protein product [Cuscuta epithymum]